MPRMENGGSVQLVAKLAVKLHSNQAVNNSGPESEEELKKKKRAERNTLIWWYLVANILPLAPGGEQTPLWRFLVGAVVLQEVLHDALGGYRALVDVDFAVVWEGAHRA